MDKFGLGLQAVINIIFYRHVDPHQGTVCPAHDDRIPDEQELIQILVGIHAPPSLVPPEIELLSIAVLAGVLVVLRPGATDLRREWVSQASHRETALNRQRAGFSRRK